MTDTEKLMVARLLAAIEDCRRPQRFKIGLPPRFNELNDRLADTASISHDRNLALETAISAARHAIG